MACYLCQRGCRKWHACVRDLLGWVVCLRWLGARVGDMPACVTCQRGLRASVGDAGGAGNEYCSKREKEFRFQVIYTLKISYFLEPPLDI